MPEDLMSLLIARAIAQAPKPRVGEVDKPWLPYQVGNIDLYNRPPVQNPDGSSSTVRSLSFENNGQEILVPTVVGGKVVSDDEAINHYFKTGNFLGKFQTPDEATRFASRLHNEYAKGKYEKGK